MKQLNSPGLCFGWRLLIRDHNQTSHICIDYFHLQSIFIIFVIFRMLSKVYVWDNFVCFVEVGEVYCIIFFVIV